MIKTLTRGLVLHTILGVWTVQTNCESSTSGCNNAGNILIHKAVTGVVIEVAITAKLPEINNRNVIFLRIKTNAEILTFGLMAVINVALVFTLSYCIVIVHYDCNIKMMQIT